MAAAFSCILDLTVNQVTSIIAAVIQTLGTYQKERLVMKAKIALLEVQQICLVEHQKGMIILMQRHRRHSKGGICNTRQQGKSQKGHFTENL